MRIVFWLAAWLIGGGLGTGPAAAEQLAALYSTDWAGLTAGQIRLGLQLDDGKYQAKLRIETAGLPRWFTRFRASVADSGEFAAAGVTDPRHYDAHFDLRKRRDRLISFSFTPTDGALQAERDTGDTSQKPELDPRYRRDVLDPLATLLSIRRWLADQKPAPGRSFQFPVYDGARRFDVNGTVVAVKHADGLIHLQLTLTPIAGFKGESSQEGDPDSAPRPLELTFSDDTRLMPVSMRVSIAFLPFTVHLERVCDDFESCVDPADTR